MHGQKDTLTYPRVDVIPIIERRAFRLSCDRKKYVTTDTTRIIMITIAATVPELVPLVEVCGLLDGWL